MAEEERKTQAKCLTCNETLVANPRRIVGCGCDPDASTWVYIETDGRIRGLSGARWGVT